VTPDKALIESRGSYELEQMNGSIVFCPTTGRPLNPRGRTGISNRGVLGKWGANFAADPIVTRYHPTKPGRPLEVVSIRRKDTGEWAIPGGMVDPGEQVSETLQREFTEEAGNVSEEDAPTFKALTEELFAEGAGRQVFRGYVDDPRNTDNAWMETTAMHFHCKDELGKLLMLHAGDDAAEVRWLEVGDHEPDYCKLYASHKFLVDKVMLTHGKSGNAAAAQ
jgi:ADP-ribose pyrophosphatase|tara:strand:+ start:886 stop:1551 length:666 start_codon:yes stop_codon:yes gene_type:complete